MHAKTVIREKESKIVIDHILADKFLTETLLFDCRAKIDSSKLTMSGHSMGGSTALRVGRSDKRVACILTFDPWLGALYKELETKKFQPFREDQAILILNTLSFLEPSVYSSDFNALRCHKYLMEEFTPCHLKEEIIITNAHHAHQNDSIVIKMLELELPRLLKGQMPRPTCHLIL